MKPMEKLDLIKLGAIAYASAYALAGWFGVVASLAVVAIALIAWKTAVSLTTPRPRRPRLRPPREARR